MKYKLGILSHLILVQMALGQANGAKTQPDTAPATAVSPVVFQRTIPDLDKNEPNILDLETGKFGQVKGTRFDTVPAAFQAWGQVGDLVWDNMQGGNWGLLSGQAAIIPAAEGEKLADKDLSSRLGKLSEILSSKILAGSLLLVRTHRNGFALGKIIQQGRDDATFAWIYSAERPVFNTDAIQRLMDASADKLGTATHPTVEPGKVEAGEGELKSLGGDGATVLNFKKQGISPFSISKPELGAPPETAKKYARALRQDSDLAYDGGLLIVGTGKAGTLGREDPAKLDGVDLSGRVGDLEFLMGDQTAEGTLVVFLTQDKKYCLAQILSRDRKSIKIRWLVQTAESAVFPSFAARAEKPTEGEETTRKVAEKDRLNQELYDAAQSKATNSNVVKVVEQIRTLVTKGADVNSQHAPVGDTALHMAAMYESPREVEVLLDLGAKVDSLSHGGATPLHYAVASGRVDNCKVLLKHGADPSVALPNGTTALEMVKARDPARDELIQLLTSSGAKITSLAVAAALGDLKSIERLAVNKEVVNQPNREGQSPLLVAVKYGKTAACKALLAAGADPNRGQTRGNSLTSPLMAAAQGGHEEIVSILLSKGAGGTGTQPADTLSVAVLSGVPAVCRLLLEAKFATDAVGSSGQTPLNEAWMYGSGPVVDAFASVTRKEPPLWTQARLGRLEPVRSLLAKKADVNQKSPEGFTALHYAVAGRHIDVARALLKSGADADLAVSGDGTLRPLHQAAFLGDAALVTLLLDEGAHVDATDSGGNTPFLEAVRLDQVEVAKVFLERGADPKAAMGLETQIKSQEMATLLQSHGVHTNRKFPQKKNPATADRP